MDTNSHIISVKLANGQMMVSVGHIKGNSPIVSNEYKRKLTEGLISSVLNIARITRSAIYTKMTLPFNRARLRIHKSTANVANVDVTWCSQLHMGPALRPRQQLCWIK